MYLVVISFTFKLSLIIFSNHEFERKISVKNYI